MSELPLWLGICRDCGAVRVKVTPYLDDPSRTHVVYYCTARRHVVDGVDRCDSYRPRNQTKGRALNSQSDARPAPRETKGAYQGMTNEYKRDTREEAARRGWTFWIDIRTCDMTLTEVMREIGRIQAQNPDQEIFMDGDMYAIIGRPREAEA